jgi:hypothetical protein
MLIQQSQLQSLFTDFWRIRATCKSIHALPSAVNAEKQIEHIFQDHGVVSLLVIQQ